MTIRKAAILGSGVIGSSWAIVYARAGLDVAIYERSDDFRATAMERLRTTTEDSASLLADTDTVDAVLARISLHDSLEAAVAGADFVHECIEEKLDSKKAIFAALNDCAPERAILATTTSSFPVSHFAQDLPCRDRCIVAHPATPPHLLPVTELCPAPFTADWVMEETTAFMRACGQTPVHIRKEVEGFVLNRMQAALVVEMLTLLRDGLIDPRDIDAIISQGFGLRWAFLGPLEGVDLNAPGGIRQYLERYGFLFTDRARDYGLGDILPPETVDALEAYTRGRIPVEALPEKVAWRDQSILALRALKAERGSVDRA
ncbi:3-hydroxyacyl-CoA dehydrogenase [Salipiger thiooxidans]|uniref:3-hydroxyacyl-CoA dehydrogenase n=1 Tax=Salipiger thiooxidans TaxID=282683 RepID=A0A1G7J0S5_9RHOB|nr:3-hydroxyacyl-CoA dehydrogenase [Salipiger thiooxidans]SDF18394.1 3-hydroxyacyl-CoA dehydrogenase [Salipiger thiooxidans]